MKKLIVIALASVALLAGQANATVTLNVGALDLLEGGSGSALAASSTLALVVIDTTAGGFFTGTLNLGQSLTAGSALGAANSVIYQALDLSVGGAGNLQASLSGLTLGGTLVAGRAVGIYWLPGLTTGNTTITMSSIGNYGMVSLGSSQNIDDPWFVPADGSTVSFTLVTASASGPDLDSLGYASHIVAIPEPSTVVLVGLGLLGAMAIRRRS